MCVLFGLLKREREKRGEKGKVRGSRGICRRHQRTANQASMQALSDYNRGAPIHNAQEQYFQHVLYLGTMHSIGRSSGEHPS